VCGIPKTTILRVLIMSGVVIVFTAANPRAHCDGLDGPVVTAAMHALEEENVNLILPWVRPEDEHLIRNAFDTTLVVRKLDSRARKLADMYFFETLVRIHRAGEGAPYTGLKPAGLDLGPAIPAADEALATESLDSLATVISHLVEEGIHRRFREAMARKHYDENNVIDAREYVEAYVTFIHYVEALHTAAQGPAENHAGESTQSKARNH